MITNVSLATVWVTDPEGNTITFAEAFSRPSASRSEAATASETRIGHRLAIPDDIERASPMALVEGQHVSG
jgi:hypothetical protein